MQKCKTSSESSLRALRAVRSQETCFISQAVQSLSCVWLFVTPWTTAHQASLSHHQLPEITQTHVHWVGDAIQPSHPLSSPSPPTFNLSQHQGLFKWVSSHQVAKLLEFQLQHQCFQRIFWMISFRVDWLDLLTVWGTLKSLLLTPQFKSINSSTLNFHYKCQHYHHHHHSGSSFYHFILFFGLLSGVQVNVDRCMHVCMC